MEGSGYGSVRTICFWTFRILIRIRTNNERFGSGRSKNIQILRIWIHNTEFHIQIVLAVRYLQCCKPTGVAFPNINIDRYHNVCRVLTVSTLSVDHVDTRSIYVHWPSMQCIQIVKGIDEQRPNKKIKTWCLGPYAGVYYTSPYVHSKVDSNTFTMGNPMSESTLSSSQGLSRNFW